MNKTVLLPLAAVSILLTSCASQHVSQPSAPVSSSVSAPMQADVSVGQDIKGHAESTVLLGLFDIGGPSKYSDGVAYTSTNGSTSSSAFSLFGPSLTEQLKAAAVYKAIHSTKNADIIVAPRYDIYTNNYLVYKTVSVSVTGKAGTINSIKSK